MSSTPPVIVHLLSGPRNVSTALMYAFAQRPDTAVVDEPLYGHYLARTRAPQPHAEELLHVLDRDGPKLVQEVILSAPPGKGVWFVKDMAHHWVDLDGALLRDPRLTNVFLVRDPEQMLPSLARQIEEPILRDAAYADQARWFRELETAGRTPWVLDAKELLLDPERVLSELCRRMGISFLPEMLRWEAGPRPEDGPWAPYWYHNVHLSTGFQPFSEKKEAFPERLRPLLEACRPHYDFLVRHAIRA